MWPKLDSLHISETFVAVLPFLPDNLAQNGQQSHCILSPCCLESVPMRSHDHPSRMPCATHHLTPRLCCHSLPTLIIGAEVPPGDTQCSVTLADTAICTAILHVARINPI